MGGPHRSLSKTVRRVNFDIKTSLDYQPLFEKGDRAPPPSEERKSSLHQKSLNNKNRMMLPYCKSKENIKEVLPYILDSTIVKRETSTTSKAVDFPIKLFGSISFGHFF